MNWNSRRLEDTTSSSRLCYTVKIATVKCIVGYLAVLSPRQPTSMHIWQNYPHLPRTPAKTDASKNLNSVGNMDPPKPPSSADCL